MSAFRRRRNPRGPGPRGTELRFSPDAEVAARTDELERFFELVFPPGFRPLFVSDATVLADFDGVDDEGVPRRLLEHYGLELTRDGRLMPLYQLLDRLGLPIANRGGN